MSICQDELPDQRFKRHRYRTEIIAYAVWLYYRFPLRLRHVEGLLAERGVDVSFQTVSEWAAKFGREFARRIRCQSRGGFADRRHLDEVVITIKGKKQWLWRAVDADGYVLDAIVQSRRNKSAAVRLLRKLLKGQGHAPRVIVTDQLGSYSAAKRQIMPGVEHRAHKGLNNRAENSHLAIRRRERNIKRFKSARHCQRFVPAHGSINNLFHVPRNNMTAAGHRDFQIQAHAVWRQIAVDISA